MRQRLFLIAKFTLRLWLYLTIEGFLLSYLFPQHQYIWLKLMSSMLITFFISFLATKSYYKNNLSLKTNSYGIAFALPVMIFIPIYDGLISLLLRSLNLNHLLTFTNSITSFLPTIIGVSLGSSNPISRNKILLAIAFLLFALFGITIMGLISNGF